MFFYAKIQSRKNAGRSAIMWDDSEQVLLKLREIYKLIIKRISETGKIEESDILFIRLYKTEFEQNTNYKKE